MNWSTTWFLLSGGVVLAGVIYPSDLKRALIWAAIWGGLGFINLYLENKKK